MSNMTTGWQLLIFGMGTVFLMLYLLSLAVKLMGKYLKPKKELAQPLEKPTIPANVNLEKPIMTTDDKNEKKVAAIMAAIQLVMNDCNYNIISIKPIGSSGWKRSFSLGQQEFKYGRRKGEGKK